MKQRQKIPPSQSRTSSGKAKKELYVEVAKYTLDLSKLVFGGVILTLIINANINKIATFVFGCITLVIFVAIGYVLLKKGKKWFNDV